MIHVIAGIYNTSDSSKDALLNPQYTFKTLDRIMRFPWGRCNIADCTLIKENETPEECQQNLLSDLQALHARQPLLPYNKQMVCEFKKN